MQNTLFLLLVFMNSITEFCLSIPWYTDGSQECTTCIEQEDTSEGGYPWSCGCSIDEVAYNCNAPKWAFKSYCQDSLLSCEKIVYSPGRYVAESEIHYDRFGNLGNLGDQEIQVPQCQEDQRCNHRCRLNGKELFGVQPHQMQFEIAYTMHSSALVDGAWLGKNIPNLCVQTEEGSKAFKYCPSESGCKISINGKEFCRIVDLDPSTTQEMVFNHKPLLFIDRVTKTLANSTLFIIKSNLHEIEYLTQVIEKSHALESQAISLLQLAMLNRSVLAKSLQEIRKMLHKFSNQAEKESSFNELIEKLFQKTENVQNDADLNDLLSLFKSGLEERLLFVAKRIDDIHLESLEILEHDNIASEKYKPLLEAAYQKSKSSSQP